MLTITEILQATGGKLIRGDCRQRVAKISTDSRAIEAGALFIALSGAKFDGHDFLKSVIQKGCCGAVVSRIAPLSYPDGFSLIRVSDTTKAFGDIARFYRRKFSIPVIAITGSCGKTTVKDMIAVVLQKKYTVLKTEGTLNNQIGIPRTLLRLNRRHEVAVVELGTNHFGEIKYLCDIVQPTIGVMINIGPSHLEFFKTLASVFREKAHLAGYLKRNGGILIYNNDDRFLKLIASRTKKFQRYTFGTSRGSGVRCKKIKQKGSKLVFRVGGHAVALKTPAGHNISNALAAIACGKIFEIPPFAIGDALARFRFPPLRMNIERAGSVTLINDAYNSNPLSLESALKTLASFNSSGRRIAVCADMLELGKKTRQLHYELGRKMAQYHVDILVTVGRYARFFSQGARAAAGKAIETHDFDSREEALDMLLNIVRARDIILIKGSRAMKLEMVSEPLKKFLKRKR